MKFALMKTVPHAPKQAPTVLDEKERDFEQCITASEVLSKSMASHSGAREFLRRARNIRPHLHAQIYDHKVRHVRKRPISQYRR